MADPHHAPNARKTAARLYQRVRPGTHYTTAARESQWLIEIGNAPYAPQDDGTIDRQYLALADFAGGVCVIGGARPGHFNLRELLAAKWRAAGARVIAAEHPVYALYGAADHLGTAGVETVTQAELADLLASYTPGPAPLVVFVDDLLMVDEVPQLRAQRAPGLFLVDVSGRPWPDGRTWSGRSQRVHISPGRGIYEEPATITMRGGRPVQFWPDRGPTLEGLFQARESRVLAGLMGRDVDAADKASVSIAQARSSAVAAAAAAVFGGASVEDAYRSANVSLPPLGHGVKGTVSPMAAQVGDVAVFTDRYVMCAGDGKVYLNGQIRPVAALSILTGFKGIIAAPPPGTGDLSSPPSG